MRRPVIEFLKVLGSIVAFLAALAAASVAMTLAGIGHTMPLLVLLVIAIGWMVFAFYRYRHARQDELLQVIATAMQAGIPLPPAIRSYLRDRPHDGGGGMWDMALLVVALPVYWLWRQRYTFDYRAAELAELLDAGVPLHVALRDVPHVTRPEVVVAAAVGAATGRAAECLRQADRERLTGAWLELAPRLLYPMFLLLFITGMSTFQAVFVMPKFQRIFSEFGEPLPPITQWFIEVCDQVEEYYPWLTAGFPIAIVVVAVLIAIPTARWYMPVMGRFTKRECQGLILRVLGTLVGAGRPADQALALLDEQGGLPWPARRRLSQARRFIQRGDPLATALGRADLLPDSMVPLVRAAERTDSLHWTLREIGELLGTSAVRSARRMSLILAPLLVISVGALVAVICIGVFTPLVAVLSRLAT